MGLHLYFPSPQVPEKHRKVRPPQPMQCQLLALLWGKKKENKSQSTGEQSPLVQTRCSFSFSPPLFSFWFLFHQCFSLLVV